MNDKIFEVNDEVEQAYKQGYEEGMRAEATKELIETASGMCEAITEVVTSTLSRVDISAMYDAKEAAKAYEELEEKHLSECRQISEYEQENRAMKSLLRETLPILRNAFFAHFEDTNKANELYDKIAAIVGKEE